MRFAHAAFGSYHKMRMRVVPMLVRNRNFEGQDQTERIDDEVFI